MPTSINVTPAEFQIRVARLLDHSPANNITFQPGDVLVTGAGAPMWGYNILTYYPRDLDSLVILV